jgi:hypothetical protein
MIDREKERNLIEAQPLTDALLLLLLSMFLGVYLPLRLEKLLPLLLFFLPLRLLSGITQKEILIRY